MFYLLTTKSEGLKVIGFSKIYSSYWTVNFSKSVIGLLNTINHQISSDQFVLFLILMNEGASAHSEIEDIPISVRQLKIKVGFN